MNTTPAPQGLPGIGLSVETVIDATTGGKLFQVRCLIGSYAFTLCQPRTDRLDAVSLRRTFEDSLRAVLLAAPSPATDPVHLSSAPGQGAWAWRAFDPDDGQWGSWGAWKISSYKPPRAPDKWFQVVDLPAASPPAGPPAGWTFYGSDFSVRATHGDGWIGSVTLIRERADAVRWYALTDEERGDVSLFVGGLGKTLEAALEAAYKAAREAPVVPAKGAAA